MTNPIKVFILGSCVSRDPFQHDDAKNFKVIDYFARSSFASLGADPYIESSIIKNIDSSFQKRMVLADMDKSVFKTLKTSCFDILLIDLIDERFNLSEVNKTIHTISSEYKHASKNNIKGRLIKSDSSEKFELWKKGFNKLMKFSIENKITEKIVINKVYWTNKTNSEKTINKFYTDQQINDVNVTLDKMYNEIITIFPKVNFIEYSDSELLSDIHHKWGVEPFHYTESFTKAQIKKLYEINNKNNTIYDKKEKPQHPNMYDELSFIVDVYGRKMHYRYTPALNESESPILVILHGHTHAVTPSKFKDPNWNIIAPIDNFGVNSSGSWWLGENGDFFVKDLLHDLIHLIQKTSQSSKGLYFWGSSMGGFGALLHGALLGAAAVYANIPQIKLLNTTYSNKGMNKFFEHIFKKNTSGEDELYNDVTNFLNSTAPSKNPLFFIAQARFDYENYLEDHSLYFFNKCLENDINIHYEIFPTKGHKVILPIHEAVKKMQNGLEIMQKENKHMVQLESSIKKNNIANDEVKIYLNKNTIRIATIGESASIKPKAFRLLHNNSTFFESKYIKDDGVVVPISETGVYRAVCLFKDKERLLSNNLVVRKIESENNQIDALTINIKTGEKRIKYIYEKEKNFYEALIKDKKALFKITNSVAQLIDICRMEKKMHARYTPFARECAKLAFKTKPCDKTLYFYLESHVLNSSFERVSEILDDIKKSPNLDKNCLSMIQLHEASLYILNKEWELYDRGLRTFKERYDPGIYWQSDLVIVDKDFGSAEKDLSGNAVNIERIPRNPKYIISISCDYNYLIEFGKIFLKSFGITCAQDGEVHIFLVNCKKEETESLLKEWGVQDFVTASYYATPEGLDFRPVSATLRLIAVHELLKKYNVPVLFSEIDCVIKKPLFKLVDDLKSQNSDQLVRTIGAYLPWQRYTCGFGVYMPTGSGCNSADLLRQYCLGLFNSKSKLMWADQCSLEASIRYSSIKDSAFKMYSPPLQEINEYIYTPTGSFENKIYKLQEIFDNLNRRELINC